MQPKLLMHEKMKKKKKTPHHKLKNKHCPLCLGGGGRRNALNRGIREILEMPLLESHECVPLSSPNLKNQFQILNLNLRMKMSFRIRIWGHKYEYENGASKSFIELAGFCGGGWFFKLQLKSRIEVKVVAMMMAEGGIFRDCFMVRLSMSNR